MIGGDFVAVLAAANDGDTRSFDVLWTDLNPALARYLRVMVGDDAESVLAQTWDDITLGMPGFRGDETAWRAWTFGIARRRAITAGRRWFTLPHAPSIARSYPTRPVGPETTLRDVVTTVALELVAALPRLQAEVLLLRTVGHLSVDETARLLQRSRRAVRSAGYRGAANVGAAGLWLDQRAAEVARPASEGAEAVPKTPAHGEQREGERWFEALLAGEQVTADASQETVRLADVLAAMTSPATAVELRGSRLAFAAFDRHVAIPAREGIAAEQRRGRLATRSAAMAVGIAAMGIGATTVAAFAGVLPAPLQDVAHHLINAPSGSSSSHGSPTQRSSASSPASTGTVPTGPTATGTPSRTHSGKPTSGAPASTRPVLGNPVSTPASAPSPTPTPTPSEVAPPSPTSVPTPTSATPTKTHPTGPPTTKPHGHHPTPPPRRATTAADGR